MTRSDRHPALLRSEDTVLMVVDMQEPFLRHIWSGGRLLDNVNKLLDTARILRVPVVPTLQNMKQMGGVIPDVASRLPAQCIPFDKMCFSCQGDTVISGELARAGRKQVILCGVETHICILQTALDLVAQGYQVHVVADAVSSRSQSDWELGLRKMERLGVAVASTEMAMYELVGEAGTPEFREILKLVKAA